MSAHAEGPDAGGLKHTEKDGEEELAARRRRPHRLDLSASSVEGGERKNVRVLEREGGEDKECAVGERRGEDKEREKERG
jgi:hypothetical protein